MTKCFPNSATVEIRDGRQRVPMKDVQIGDQILVDVDSHGQRIYEPVYAFIHASETGMYDYLKITVEQTSEQPLTVSSNHLIFRFNQTRPCFAGHLNIGDRLQVISNDGLFRAGAIQDIRLIKSQGFYAPLTRSGKLVVDGISVSNYALVANHQLAHLAIQPYRWALSLLDSSSYSEQIHWYCRFLYSLVEQIDKWLLSVDLYDGQLTVSHF